MSQTTVQRMKTIRFGSAMIEVGDSEANLRDIGAANNVSFEYSFDEQTIKSDNAGDILKRIANERARVSCDMLESSVENIASFLKGVVTTGSTSATSQTVSGENVVTQAGYVRLANKNGDGTQVTISTCKKGNTSLTVSTDYTVGVDAQGYTIIAPVSGSSKVTAGDTITVGYSYTPNASEIVEAGGKLTLAFNIVRLTNFDSDGKKFEITMWKASGAEGFTMDFQPDDADTPNAVNAVWEGINDAGRDSGKQLFRIVDEQGV